MAKLVYQLSYNRGGMTNNGVLFTVIDKDKRGYELYTSSNPEDNRNMRYPCLGVMQHHTTETLFYETYGYKQHDFIEWWSNVHLTDERLFFNYMRMISDLVNGKDVILYVGEYDDLSLEILQSFLYDRYGINLYNGDDKINEIPDIQFDKTKINVLQQDLEKFRHLSYHICGENDYYEKFFQCYA